MGTMYAENDVGSTLERGQVDWDLAGGLRAVDVRTRSRARGRSRRWAAMSWMTPISLLTYIADTTLGVRPQGRLEARARSSKPSGETSR